MENKAVVSVKGVQYIDGEKSVTELICEGSYSYDDNLTVITYQEYDDETGLKTVSELNIQDNSVVLTREGGQSTRMEFEKEKRCVGYYELPFGGFSVSTFTSCLEKDFTEKGGHLKVSYRLELDRLASTDNEIEVAVKLRG